MKRLALALISLYQVAVSAYTPRTCRFTPSCSRYGHEAIEKYGLLKGCWLTAKRICRCHPLGDRGLDPVP